MKQRHCTSTKLALLAGLGLKSARAASRAVGIGLVCGLAGTAHAQPVNDNCIDAIPIFVGPTDYDTTGANTDGPQHGPGGPCQFNGQTYHDIWYNYTADFTGLLTVSTCNEDGGNGNYDTDLVVYNGCDCLNLILLGCSDDAPAPCSGDNPFLSRKVVPVVAGNCYLIRVGGWNPGDQGTGTVSLVKSVGPGACCLPDGSCIDVEDPQACAAAGGTFQGAGGTCAKGACPDPPVYVWTTDEAEFEAEVAAAGKVNKGTENFPWTAPDGQLLSICDPLDTTDAVPGWIEPGVLLDNLTWQGNLGGADPTFPIPRCPVTGQNGLLAATPGLVGATDTVLVANNFFDAFDIISGPPAGDNHTAMAMTLVAFLGVQTVNVTVFDKDNVNLGTVTNVPAPVTGGGFLGIIMPEGVTIGRVNLYDPSSGLSSGAEGVYDVAVYVSACPWDLTDDGDVGVPDLLLLLAAWGPCPPKGDCPADFTDDGDVGVPDLLLLLANWGSCP